MHVRLFCPARLIVVVLALSPLWLSAVPARQAVAAPPAVTVQPLLQRAQLDFDKKEYVAAMVLFTEATVLAPMNATAWAGKARSESFLDNDVAAVSDYSTAITLAPANATYRLRRGLSYNSLYDYDEAMRDFDAAIRLNPKLADAYYDRATIEDVRGDYMAAVADDTQGIRWNPAWWQGYMNRGESELSLQEWQASIADLTVYIQHTAKAACACAYYERGNAYFHLGEYAKAYSDHKQAITLGWKYALPRS